MAPDSSHTDRPQSQDTTLAVDLEGVAVQFATERGTVTALQGINLKVPRGGFVALLGPSGCGKSTLLRVVADIVAPAAGRVSILGGTPKQARLNGDIGFVFQDAALLPWRTVKENIELPLGVGGRVRKQSGESAALIGELLDLVGLGDWANAYPNELSGGMRQRVSIARALVTRPKLLLMDEPFGALDEITRDRLNEELLRVWERTDTTILFVTHSIYEAAFMGQDVLILASRPGQVQGQVSIDLPRPRRIAVKETPEFIQLAAHLRRVLEGRS